MPFQRHQTPTRNGVTSSQTWKAFWEPMERDYILARFNHFDRDIARTARSLEVSRTFLYSRLRAYRVIE